MCAVWVTDGFWGRGGLSGLRCQLWGPSVWYVNEQIGRWGQSGGSIDHESSVSEEQLEKNLKEWSFALEQSNVG